MAAVMIPPNVLTTVAGTDLEVRHNALFDIEVQVDDKGAVWLPQLGDDVSWELTPGSAPLFWQGQNEPIDVPGYALVEGRWQVAH